MKKVRVRFAPSPTGFLHVGNARTALFNWLFARQSQGDFVLRVEDTDRERSSSEFEQSLVSDLRWLGLDWDEGPDAGGEFGPYRQSQRLSIYKKYTAKLLEEANAYSCFCSPEELEGQRQKARSRGKLPVYSGRCRSLSADKARRRIEGGEPFTVRLRTPDKGTLRFGDLIRGELAFDLELIGDPILVRANGFPSYNYVVVIDDALMKISHVIRGEDHISNTPRQILTYQALGFDPPEFAHLSMVMGQDNSRLSKRHGATSVEQFIQEGILPEALFNYLALLGWAPPDGHEVLSRAELTSLFQLKKVSRSAAVFDYDKLHWINRQHLTRLPPRAVAENALPHLQKAGMLPGKMTAAHWDWLEKAVEVLAPRVDKAADFPGRFALFFDFSADRLDDEARIIMEKDCGRRVVKAFAGKMKKISRFDYEAFAAMTQQIGEETGCKGRDLYKPLRVALTASGSGLDLDKLIPLVESGASLTFPKPIKTCAARAAEIAALFEDE